MPVQINPLEVAALAALAQNRAPSLNLPLHSLDPSAYWKPLFERRKQVEDLQQQYAQQANMFNIAQLGEQGADKRQQNLFGFQGEQNNLTRQQQQQEFQATNALNQAQLAEQAQYHQGSLGVDQGRLGLDTNRLTQEGVLKTAELTQNDQYRQGQIDIEQQKIVESKYEAELKNMMEMKKEDRNQRGATAFATLIAMKNASTPEEKIAAGHRGLESALSDGLITKEQHKTLSALPPEQLEEVLTRYGVIAAMAEKGNSGVGQGIGAALGTNVLAKDVQSDVQKQQVANTSQISQIQDLREKVNNAPPGTFTYYGNIANSVSDPLYGKSSTAVKNIVSPIASAMGFDKEHVQAIEDKTVELNSGFANLRANVAKEISPGMLRREDNKLLDALVPTMGYLGDSQNTVNTKLDALEKIKSNANILNSRLLDPKTGKPKDPKQYSEALGQVIQAGVDEYDNNRVITLKDGRTVSKAAREATYKANPKLSKEEINKYYGWK